MVFFPVPLPAGIVKTDSPYSVAGRWIDGDKVRFRGGRAEKIGGAAKFVEGQFEGYARGAHAWVVQGSFPCVVFGTASTLYLIRSGSITDITPFRVADIALTDPFTTTNGSAIVTVADTAHGITTVGTRVLFEDATAVGGITIDGEYEVTEILDDDSFTITHTSAASSAATGGGSVTASYYINVGLVDPSSLTGWGVGPWGVGGWGVGVSAAYGILLEPLSWSMDNYGEDLVLCPLDGTVYLYDASAGAVQPTPISNAPAKVRAVFVTPERYIFALGCTTIAGSFDAMTVRWPDVEDMTDWSPSSVDTANQRRLQGGSRLMAGCGFQQGLSLVWSDSHLFAFQFTGTSTIYDSRPVGSKCGLIAPKAFAKTDNAVYWMSNTGFHVYNGMVQEIPNAGDIDTWVFENINRTHAIKCGSFYNEEFNEVWFLYPAGVSTENNRYVAVCLDDFSWTIGTWDRTTAAKFEVGERRPLMFGTDGYVWAHEADPKNDNTAAMESFIESSPFDLDEGNTCLDVWGFVPDFERQSGDLTLYMYGIDHPRDGVASEDTVTISETDEITDMRLAGRQIAFRLTSDAVDGDFRLGKCQLEISAAGKKRSSRST
jgi:hypothetical protein